MSDLGDYSLDYHEGASLALGERLHATLGASSSERWMNCPRSVTLSKGMPNRSSMFAMEGTAAHHLGELCLTQNLSADTFRGMFMTYAGDLVDDKPDLGQEETVFFDGELYAKTNPTFEINDDMVRAVNVYLNAVESRMIYARDLYKEEPQLLTEKAFNLSEIYPDMFGTNDVCVYIPGLHLDVMDYKHGRGKVVKVKNNSQLKYYALGALLNLCRDEFDEPAKVTTAIIQPRASHPDGPVRWASYTNHELSSNFRFELVAAAKRTEDPCGPMKEGEWCFFCPAKTICPLITERIHKGIGVSMSDLSDEELGLTVGTNAPAVIKKAVTRLTDDPVQLGRFLSFVPIMESVIKETKAIALERALEGNTVPGQKLIYGDKHRIYKDESGLKAELAKNGIKPEDYMEKPKPKTPSQMEKLKTPDGRSLKPIIAPYVDKPKGPLKLVDQDHEAEEVKVGIEDNSFDLI